MPESQKKKRQTQSQKVALSPTQLPDPASQVNVPIGASVYVHRVIVNPTVLHPHHQQALSWYVLI